MPAGRGGNKAAMTDETQDAPAPGSGEAGAIVEPPNSTVNDWHGQVEQRQEQLADEALADAGGDEARAEQLFRERGGDRPEDLPPK
jgi:hypothetical protein